ncbi:MAG: UDP-N-acetylmuramate--L-alanine ligase [Gammaproteobacteria bacterium]|nr:UDP-N-acetylmuramate--L-alanine ligase [Gammaproteobacteria bacterium]
MKTQLPMRHVHHIHFVGIGGAGMCGIAEVLLNQGYKITGSDLSVTPITERLQQLGAVVYRGHNSRWVEGADVLVISSAIQPDNPEVAHAKALNIPIIPRAQMLAELMRFRYGIAISGTHGKTTTTSLVTSILAEADLDPTFVIGGRLNSVGVNARLGTSEYLVAEADESDASFLYLMPTIAIVTNIDADHMETYGNDFECLKDAFIEFVHRIPFYGLAVLCIDDPVLKEIMPKILRPKLTYGFNEGADFRAFNFRQEGTRTHFRVKRPGSHPDLSVQLNLPGQHNALNALAAIAIGTDLGIPDDIICRALEKFSGVGRRFQRLGEYDFGKGTATLIDDYGHHPREIEMTIQSARASWPERRVVMVFQPHRYTRTRDLFKEFVQILSLVDQLFLLDIYPASEKPIPGVTTERLCECIIQRGIVKPIYIPDKSKLGEVLEQTLHDHDVLIAQGAGDISQLAAGLMKS